MAYYSRNQFKRLTTRRLPWKKQKTLAMLANRRQYLREFDPSATSETEIMTEGGIYLITEGTGNYIATG